MKTSFVCILLFETCQFNTSTLCNSFLVIEKKIVSDIYGPAGRSWNMNDAQRYIHVKRYSKLLVNRNLLSCSEGMQAVYVQVGRVFLQPQIINHPVYSLIRLLICWRQIGQSDNLNPHSLQVCHDKKENLLSVSMASICWQVCIDWWTSPCVRNWKPCPSCWSGK